MESAPSIPHSQEAEVAVIGSVLISPDAYSDVAFLKPEDFYINRHTFIWRALVALVEKRSPIDILTVQEELDQVGLLAEIGGPAYLTSLIAQSPMSYNVAAYGKIVESHSIRRKMIRAASQIATLAFDEKLPVEKALDNALQEMYKAADRQTHNEVTLGQAVSEAYDISENAAKNGETIGVETGFIDLDRILGGLKNGKLYDVAGRPGKGKTALVLDFAINAAVKHHKRARIFSQEMNYIEIANRIASKTLDIDTKKIEEGALSAQEWERYLKLVEDAQDYERYPIIIDETVPLTPNTLHAICKSNYMRGNLDLVIIDYVQLLEGTGDTLREKITDVSRNMKRLARELNIPVVAAAQLSRNAVNGRPQISDMQETGALEQDADVVMLLHDDETNFKITKVIIGKHRGGPTGEIDLYFKKNLTKFENAATKMINFNGG